ncbi:MAG: hypothetical protein PHP52_12740 [Bacteroidales bacterium]|nr:hypothetical protein [Bacteroidales bacterium]MDD4216070.1 hypothetical protein [Bacteroidales bacterium]MDY0143783.1 hypothetical protein [Bacteroidales bacterium]
MISIKLGNEYAIIREKEFDLLRKIEKHGLKVSIEPLAICKGNRVEIISGLLKGYKGICIEESNNNYVSIAIKDINQNVKVIIGKEMIRKI